MPTVCQNVKPSLQSWVNSYVTWEWDLVEHVGEISETRRLVMAVIPVSGEERKAALQIADFPRGGRVEALFLSSSWSMFVAMIDPRTNHWNEWAFPHNKGAERAAEHGP